MKLGISLPNTLVPSLNRGLFLDWCRVSDQAGFHVFGTIDQPSYDSWDPLATLAAAAAVTERVRLATTILQLPNRNEVIVAKQAAVIDRLSGGRLDLGVAIGAREADFKALGARMAGRGKKIERQIRKIRKVWRVAKRANEAEGALGPAPLQKPLPPIWMGGYSEPARRRAVEIGDAFMFGAAGIEAIGTTIPQIKGFVAEKGKKTFPIGAIAYCAIGDDPQAAFETGSRTLMRYYGGQPPRALETMIHPGPTDALAQTVKEYDATGLDVLILIPLIPDVRQVEQIAEHILPTYRVPSR